MLDSVCKILSTFFCVGNLPVAPGSIATFVGIFISFALAGQTGLYVFVMIAVTIVGFIVSGRAERAMGKKDPGSIVIDEVSGVMIALFLLPPTWPVFWTGFFLFRAFDMFKIYPGNKFEGLGGSSGIMMDDIIAGIYTNAVMHLALMWASY
jgi:phosphatidylglycerophosphatase A